MAEGATDGPWGYDKSSSAPLIGSDVYFGPEWDGSDADMEFIAEARSAVPALVAEVRRLRTIEAERSADALMAASAEAARTHQKREDTATRDMFAAHLAAALVQRCGNTFKNVDDTLLAARAYELVDAMMAERARRGT